MVNEMVYSGYILSLPILYHTNQVLTLKLKLTSFAQRLCMDFIGVSKFGTVLSLTPSRTMECGHSLIANHSPYHLHTSNINPLPLISPI